MGDNIFGMDIRRFSVLFIAIIIILAFLGSFTNIKIPQNSITIQIGSGGGNSGSYNVPGPKYIYNKTITLAPSLSDLQYVRGSYSNLPAPYYYIPNTNIPILFNFSNPENNVLNLLLNALAWNASVIAPGPYGALLSIASSAYVKIPNYTNVTLQPFPLNANDTENYSKWGIIIKYAKTLEAPNGFQPGWSYPPSDLITVDPLSYKTINETSVQTSVSLVYSVSSHTTTITEPYLVYTFNYLTINGTAYLYANGKLLTVQNFYFTAYPGMSSYDLTIYGDTTVPPGVVKQVYGIAEFIFQSTGWAVTLPNGVVDAGSIISLQNVEEEGFTFTWYEYNVSLPLHVQVFNGTNPITYLNNIMYSNRTISYTLSYTIWSSLPQSYSEKISTRDTIQVGNYTVNRTWNAGAVTIVPKIITQQIGNTINYYLTFNVQNDLTEPPAWINQTMSYNKYAALAWFSLEQNASLAHALYSYIMNTINKSDLQFWKFEYFVLVSEFVMYSYNTTYSVYNNLLELESFYENWSLVISDILNLSAWPNLKYSDGVLMFFNVSRIPPIYNVTTFFNISGNYEVYLTDIYNALYYKQWNKVPFGNEYYFYNPLTNQTIYFYLNTSRSPIPYINEPLGFESVNYIPYIFYGTFQYPAATEEKIISIWNGTAWIS
jgi:hypothetical protein